MMQDLYCRDGLMMSTMRHKKSKSAHRGTYKNKRNRRKESDIVVFTVVMHRLSVIQVLERSVSSKAQIRHDPVFVNLSLSRCKILAVSMPYPVLV